MSYGDQIHIPPWIKNTANWWSKNQIGDSDFVKGIQYLIEHDVIKIPKTETASNSQNTIPSWIKNNAGWWANGTITDDDFIKVIQYLVKVNIIQVAPENMMLSSSVFDDNGTIPSEYTCDGNNISPPLEISFTPKNTASLVLIMDDPDAKPSTFVHWIVWNIAPDKTGFSKGEKSSFPQGKNSLGNAEYVGPCPPTGTHRYFFKLYALDIKFDFSSSPTKQDLEQAMGNHILMQTTLLGKYSRG